METNKTAGNWSLDGEPITCGYILTAQEEEEFEQLQKVLPFADKNAFIKKKEASKTAGVDTDSCPRCLTVWFSDKQTKCHKCGFDVNNPPAGWYAKNNNDALEAYLSSRPDISNTLGYGE